MGNGMKMAKASQRDLDAAMELYQFLQAAGDGRGPEDVVDEFGYKGYDDLLERQAPDVEFMVRAHERGGLFRVVWGMQVLLDPRNEIVDPALDYLEHHPKHADAAALADSLRAQLAAVTAQRDELVAAVLPVLEKIEPKPSPFQPLLMALVAAVKAAEQPKPQQPEVQP